MADRKPTVSDGDTRKHILQLLLEHNPASTAFIADTLGLSTAGVHRHIDVLVNEDLAETAPAPSIGPRGRGRPTRSHRLTDRGHARFGHAYDNLTNAALTTLRRAGDEQAVTQFVRQRINDILLGVTPVGRDAEKEEAIEAVVDTFR